MLCRNQQPSEQPPNDLASPFSRGQFRSKLFVLLVPGGGVEPPREVVSADFESAASASSAIPAEGGRQASVSHRGAFCVTTCGAFPWRFWAVSGLLSTLQPCDNGT